MTNQQAIAETEYYDGPGGKPRDRCPWYSTSVGEKWETAPSEVGEKAFTVSLDERVQQDRCEQYGTVDGLDDL